MRRRKRDLILVSAPVFSDRLGRRPLHARLYLDEINQIADSLREFGFIMPVVVDHAQQVVIGHARVLAAKKLEMPQIPVVEIRHLSKAQLKALRLADNKLAQNAHWDERLLGESFLELKELDIDFETLGQQMLARKKDLKKNGVPRDAEHAMLAKANGKSDSPAAASRRKSSVLPKAATKAPAAGARKSGRAHASR